MSDIPTLAHRIALAISQLHPSFNEYSDFDRGMAISDYMLGPHESVAQLKAAVAADDGFGHLRQGWLDRGSGGGGVIQNHMLPHLFVSHALEGKDIEELLASARRFAESRTSNVDTFFPVAGINVTDVVMLREGLTLLPWGQVPEGRGRKWFEDASDPARMPLGTFRGVAVQPTLAIRHRERNRKILFASHEEAYLGGSRLNDVGAQWTLTADVIRCITATAVWPVGTLGSWTQLDEAFGDRLGAGGYHFTRGMSDLLLARTAPDPIDAPKIVDLFARYIAIEGEDKDVLRIGLDRLGLSLRENVPPDKAIDLGIALEAMLLHGTGDADRGELTYRAAIRGATFLGGGCDERLNTFNLLRDAYRLRSSAVHTGRLGNKKIRGMSPADILSGASAKCAAIARKLIGRGSFPDWEREYVVGDD